MRLLLVAAIVLAAGLAWAQGNPASNELPGTILIQVSPALDSALGAAFESARPANDPDFSHSDINRAAITNDSVIRSLLALPLGRNGLNGLELRPYIPTHSIAFQDIRVRSNPQLFQHGYSVNGSHSREQELRAAENRIAHWFVLSFSNSMSDDAAVLAITKSSLVIQAEPSYVRFPCYTPNDPQVNQQYALSMMHCFQAWDVVRCDSTMVLADVDVGIDWSHPDLEPSIYLNQGEIGIDSNGVDKRSNGVDDDHNGFIDDWHGWDFAGADNTFGDNDARSPGSDHGTRTAGIMAATGNNNIGIAGVAFGSRVIPIKVACDYCGSLDYGFQGIIYAADMHAKVINCSWGGPTYSGAEQDVIDYAYAKDCAVVAAAGNNGIYQNFYPASYRHVLSVAMVDQNGNIVDGSNFNPYVDVSAPGWGVLSTAAGNSYDAAGGDGTSFASPNAAGVVALVRQRFPALTAGQAMEQVRVTGNAAGGLSDNRVDFEGHGTVDALTAVTDTNTHSARVDSVAFVDASGNGFFMPGESGGVVLYVRNYLKPVQHLEGRLEIVNGADYVTLAQSIVPFGAAGTMQEIANDPLQFQIAVASNVPPNTHVLVRIFFSDSSVGYYDDYDYVSFIVNPTYLDLDRNNLTVTFSSFGSIGYNDVLVNEEGSGFLWRVAPSIISPQGRSVLYQGGLMAGTDTDHVVDVVEGSDQYTADMDFTPAENVHYVTPPDHLHAVQELACGYTDSLADPNKQIGIAVTSNAYAFDEGLAANAVVIRYVFRHDSANQFAPPASDSTAAALYTDWDIGLSGSDNLTRFDSATQTALTYRLNDENYPIVGVKLLSPVPPGAQVNYRAVMNDGSQGGIDPYQGLSTLDKWTMMNRFFQQAGPGDVSEAFGLKNMSLASQDSVEMTLVIALGQDIATLNQTIQQTATLWAENSAVNPNTPATAATLEVFPNPFQRTLHLSWDIPGPAHVTIFDELGRVVASRNVSGSSVDLTQPALAAGMYTIDVTAGGSHLRREVIARP